MKCDVALKNDEKKGLKREIFLAELKIFSIYMQMEHRHKNISLHNLLLYCSLAHPHDSILRRLEIYLKRFSKRE